MRQITEIFGENLRLLRKEAGLTQAELGEKLFFTEKAVSKWESGTAFPRPETLISISELFQISIDALLQNHRGICYYIGIDGGGTKTMFALADAEGRILRSLCLGACNPMTVGFEKSIAVLREGLRELAAGIPLSRVSLYAGIAGISGQEETEAMEQALQDMRPGRLAVGNDSENAVSAGLAGRDGMTLILGTGCNLFTQKNGVRSQYGGLGYLFDNGGNAFSLGRDALHAVMYEESGISGHTLLTELFHEKYRTDARSLLPELYRQGNRGIAAYAVLVFEAAGRGDAEAKRILKRNMAEIAGLLDAGLGDFKGKAEPVPVVTVGGLTSQSEVLFPLILEHMKQPERVTLSVYPFEPVLGALRLAGAPVNTEEDGGLDRSCRP